MPNLESLTLPIKVGNTKTNVKYDIPQGNVLQEDLEDYAKNNGYYDEFTAGSAEQLLSTQFVEDSVPYKFRTSGGSKDIGNREYDEIVGGSIVWNQLVRKVTAYYPQTSEVTITFSEGHTIINGTPSQDVQVTLDPVSVGGKANHTYIFLCKGWQANGNWKWGRAGFNYYSKEAQISKHTADFALNPKIQLYAGTTYNIDVVFSIIDLTAMFGSTIADYIYSLESAEAGKGVAFFKSLFPNDYYPYNAGELLSVEGLQSHDTVGFNQWDGTYSTTDKYLSSAGVEVTQSAWDISDYIPIIANTLYCFTNLNPTATSACVCWYDSDKNFISSSAITSAMFTATSPSNAMYVRASVNKATKDTACINLSWSGWRNGEYEPYKKHSYALDSSLTLRGIPKLNAQNELYFDGDIYSHDGKTQRRYGEYDLGDWDGAYVGDGYFFGKVLPYIKKCDNSLNANCLCKAYIVDSANNINNNVSDKRIGVNSEGRIVIRDTSFADIASFKTAMSGVMLIYELATPTEETAEPYTSPQNVDDFGTEEYISGNIVPVGHNTKYPANLRDKLQHLPNMADSDGYYMISQQNKQMSLELFRIPKAPTTDGNYTLKAHVSGGTPTYVWESEETE